MGSLLWSFIAPLSILVPLLIAVTRFRRLHPVLKIIWYYLLFAGLVNLAGIVLAKNTINNMPLSHLFTYGEMVLLLYFFSRLWNNPRISWYILLIWLAFTVFFVFNICFFQALLVYNSYSRSLEAFIMLVFCIVFFYRQLNEPVTDEPWYTNPFTWTVMGLLLYFSGALFLFVFSEYISRDMSMYKLGWSIHALLVVLMYVLFAISFLQSNKTVQYEPRQ